MRYRSNISAAIATFSVPETDLYALFFNGFIGGFSVLANCIAAILFKMAICR